MGIKIIDDGKQKYNSLEASFEFEIHGVGVGYGHVTVWGGTNEEARSDLRAALEGLSVEISGAIRELEP